MKKATIVAMATVLTAAAAVAQAQVKSPLYVEGNVTSATTDFGDNIKFKPRMVSATVGYDVHPNIAVEGMLGVNASKGTSSLTDVDTGVTVSTSLKYTSSYGIFVKPHVALTPEFDLFARVGYVKSRAKLTAGSNTLTDSDGDFAYGIGGNFNIDSNLYATLGYMVYYKKDDVKTDGFNVGLGYRF